MLRLRVPITYAQQGSTLLAYHLPFDFPVPIFIHTPSIRKENAMMRMQLLKSVLLTLPVAGLIGFAISGASS